MYVKDILDLAKIKVGNLVIQKNDDALIKFVYLGTSELYRRFNLAIKSETIEINDRLSLYELRNSDVSLLLDVYNQLGKELTQTDASDDNNYDYEMLNYKSFLLRRPFNGLLYAVYKASPVVFKDADDMIDLPDCMIDALLTYVAYMSHSTINRDNVNEANIYSRRFDDICKELEMQGYRVPLRTKSLSLQAKGFI